MATKQKLQRDGDLTVSGPELRGQEVGLISTVASFFPQLAPASWYISHTVGSWCLSKLGLLNTKDKKERLWNTVSIKYLNRELRDCNCRVVELGLVRMALGQMCTRVIWTRIGQDLGTRQFAPAVCDLIYGACELGWRHCYNLWSYQGLHRTKGADVPNFWSLMYVAYQWWFGLSFCRS